jgi:Lon protease-like protein
VTTHDLPSRFAIFPLPNIVLFPDVRLPLHIFEPRYRQMTADALDGDRVIGMVLLRADADRGSDAPAIFDVGCVGRISESQQLPDGRSNIVLDGLVRFRVLEEEQAQKLYRIVQTELLPEPSYAELDAAGQRELDQARDNLEHHLLELARRTAPGSVEVLRERVMQLDPMQLAHALAFGLDTSFVEKQSLLEAPGPLARCALLARLLEFRQAETELPNAPKSLN